MLTTQNMGAPEQQKEAQPTPNEQIVGIRLPCDLKMKFKSKAAAEGKSMSDVVMELVKKYVGD